MEENILNILLNISENVYWDGHLENIEEGVKKYQDAISKNIRDSDRHLNPILPNYWEVFHTHNIYRRRKGELHCRRDNTDLLPCYDVGIFLVGYSSLPIVLSLAEIQPSEQIYFLYSSDIERGGTLDEISKRIKVMRPECTELIDLVGCSINRRIDNPSDPVATFKQIKEVINDIDDNKQVALDLTGGKKTMVGGGFTAGAILGFSESIERSVCDMYYVDSLEYDQRQGSPKPGTEFLSRLENPYNVYNIQSVQEAKTLSEQHNYEAAERLWKSVRDKLNHYAIPYDLTNELIEAEQYYGRAYCYNQWDAFNYGVAKRRKTYRYNKSKYSWGYTENHTVSRIDVLDILNNTNSRRDLFAEDKNVIHYAVDRYQNAIRRVENGNFDDAIVRFTQVVEMLCNYKIYRIASDRKLINQSKDIVNPPRKWNITPLINLLFGKSDRYIIDNRRYYKISDQSELLCINQYGYKNVKQITDLIEYRNDFIHFNRSANQEETKKTMNALQNVARKFLKNFSVDYCEASGLSFKKLLKLHEFVR